MWHMTEIIEMQPLWSLIQSDPALLSSVEIKLWKQQKISNGQICRLFIADSKLKRENEETCWLTTAYNPFGLK